MQKQVNDALNFAIKRSFDALSAYMLHQMQSLHILEHLRALNSLSRESIFKTCFTIHERPGSLHNCHESRTPPDNRSTGEHSVA